MYCKLNAWMEDAEHRALLGPCWVWSFCPITGNASLSFSSRDDLRLEFKPWSSPEESIHTQSQQTDVLHVCKGQQTLVIFSTSIEAAFCQDIGSAMYCTWRLLIALAVIETFRVFPLEGEKRLKCLFWYKILSPFPFKKWNTCKW